MDNSQICNWISVLSAVATLLSAVATLFIAIFAFRQMKFLGSQVEQTNTQLKLLKLQVEQSSAQILTNASNAQNWKLFEHWKELPPFLPSWSDLNTQKKWAWRVLHFNHLNLLQLAYQEHKRGLIEPDDMKSWRDKAKSWYENFWEPNPDKDMVEGRDILKQVLQPKEGFPKEFREWLVKENIIPPNFVPD